MGEGEAEVIASSLGVMFQIDLARFARRQFVTAVGRVVGVDIVEETVALLVGGRDLQAGGRASGALITIFSTFWL